MNFTGKFNIKNDLQDFLKSRKIEWRILLFITLWFLFGLWLVYEVKTQRPMSFNEIPGKLSKEIITENGKKVFQQSELLNLSNIKNAVDLKPFLTNFEEDDEKSFVADKIYKWLEGKTTIKNVGVLGGIRVNEDEIENAALPESFRSTLKTKIAAKNKGDTTKVSVPLIRQVSSIKSSFIVRTPSEFLNSTLLYAGLFLLAFWGPHVYWRIRNFRGDQLILPNIFALCCFGFLMMISLRDPLRDALIFADFAKGILLGGAAIIVLTSFDYHKIYYSFKDRFARADLLTVSLPILLSLLFCLLLALFGKGPTGSDAKVNLNVIGFDFQPSELIKILIVLFIAAYFSRKWELIKNLDEKRFQLLSLPRIKDVWIVFLCVGLVLGLFIVQKDLGPALLMAGTFLTLFAVLRKRLFLSFIGFLLIVGAYAFNYYVFRFSRIAADRLDIWASPWNTSVGGGEQIVQSFWALATGGFTGTGIGLGDPRFAPAAHTDLILSSLGEEFGFIGLFVIFALYATMFYRSIKIASNSTSVYTFFLVLGVAVINTLQILFMSAAVLGLIPLSGMVSPFLSYGSTSMIINFLSFGIVLVISGQDGKTSADIEESFAFSNRYLSYGLAVLALIVLLNAAWIQLWKADEILVRSILAPQPDEVYIEEGRKVTYAGIRRYQENPRIRQVLRELPYGSIYDRNGIPMASSNWEELQKYKEVYKTLNVELEDICQKGKRCYPFGAKTFFLLGDIFTKKNWQAPNNFIEREYEMNLTGLTGDYVKEMTELVKVLRFPDEVSATEDQGGKVVNFAVKKREYQKKLISLLRSRYSPFNSVYRPAYKNLYTSIDIKLQLSLTDILRKALEANKKKGAIVVLDPQSGDLLASVSYPFPEEQFTSGKSETGNNVNGEVTPSDRLIDRARWGQYPPGSVFKVITGMAALRKHADAFSKTFECQPLDDKRVGKVIQGQTVADKLGDPAHKDVGFERGLTVSCNAYFAQLGADVAGAEELFGTLKLFGIKVSSDDEKDNVDTLRKKENLIHSSYGQGSLLATPFQIAKVAAAVANDGTVPFGRWVIDENNTRNSPGQIVITQNESTIFVNAMRKVVADKEGTANKLAILPVQIAGKTGTAETKTDMHSWFIGFAPVHSSKMIAFAVIVENGGAGSGIAAEISGKLVLSSQQLGVTQ